MPTLLIDYYSGLLKIRTPKKPDFCVFAKQGLSKKSGLVCSRQTGLVLKIRTYDFANMELVGNIPLRGHITFLPSRLISLDNLLTIDHSFLIAHYHFYHSLDIVQFYSF